MVLVLLVALVVIVVVVLCQECRGLENEAQTSATCACHTRLLKNLVKPDPNW